VNKENIMNRRKISKRVDIVNRTSISKRVDIVNRRRNKMIRRD